LSPNTKNESPVLTASHPRIVLYGFDGIEVPQADYEKLSGNKLGETSESIRKRMQTAKDIQNQRFSNSNPKAMH